MIRKEIKKLELFDALKKLLDIGLTVESENYKMNKTNWGDGKASEYALHYNSGKVEYFYCHEAEGDLSYKDAFEIFIGEILKQTK